VRFLIVPATQAADARDVIAALHVGDVLVVTDTEHRLPSPLTMSRLRGASDRDICVCGLLKSYRRAVRHVFPGIEDIKVFRTECQILRAWILPTSAAAPPAILRPAAALVAGTGYLLAEHAVVEADLLDPLRDHFVTRSLALLTRLADGEQLGPRLHWKDAHGVHCAQNGKESVEYVVVVGGKKVLSKDSVLHLTSGNHTDRDKAARIYFDVFAHEGREFVAVLYCGPHPKEGVVMKRRVIVTPGSGRMLPRA